MRLLKITIFSAVLITFVMLVGIGYVWRELAFTSHTIVSVDSVEPIATTSALEKVASTSSAAALDRTKSTSGASQTSSATTASSSAPTPISEPITVSTSDLPDAQRAVLDTLGMDGASITITPKMVECAIDALGEERVLEIQKGDAPGLAEGLTLIACMKK